jgi:hypothetical protein
VNELVKSLKFVVPESPGTAKKFQVPCPRKTWLSVPALTTPDAVQPKSLHGAGEIHQSTFC